ncbi:MAG: hypothetical protein AB8B50_08290, partial [Pirellulaceae bacterium]
MTTTRTFLLVVSFALVVRASVLFLDTSPERLLNGIGYQEIQIQAADPDSYGRLALNLARTGIYGFGSELTAEDPLSLPSEDIAPTAFRPVLYPWLLHWLVQAGRVDGAAVVALH